ncbi:Putative oxidoreductase MhqP [Marinomonas spartinae]|uniref:Putative oxidoreductase MhqP n=1 Tax=Marinomonas spartinae TaxID=1792290 RepID=A0A1A8T7Y5_9GAMM|nr:DoxX family protein [Marinomonas spartinae]SBS27563.1 Putative oxidoreductase MhqP [Marinomonas spartinae]SBS29962.1 Putative oxidoreductase MhqP [Marinomonas spartinae]
MSSTLLSKITTTTAGLSSTILRIPVGLILMGHGSQKLFGMFGGYGLAGTGQYMSSLGLHPGELMAALAGSAEFFGGLALLIGLLVRPATVFIAFTMLVAIFTVHISHGLFIQNGGYEYALTLIVICVSLFISGAGPLSVDKALSNK